MIDLTGKSVVITGSTRGFGLEIARSVLKHGGNVFISSRSQSAVDSALQQLNDPAHAAGLPCDVGDLQQVQSLSAAAIQAFGSYQVWINNAGLSGPYGATLQIDPQVFRTVIQTNILGAYYGSLTALKQFEVQQNGKLINILGHGYKGPVPFQSAYSSSKGWLRSFTMSLAAEIDSPAIGVFAFNPGMMLTDLLTNVEVFAGSEDRLKAFPTVIRLFARSPEVAAERAAWVASSATDGKTGKLYNIHSNSYVLKSVILYLWQKIARQPTAEINLRIHSIAPFHEK